MGSKAERNKARRLKAIKDSRLKHMIAFSVVVANAWLESGNTVGPATYGEIDITPEQMRFTKSQWKKILKYRDDIIARLGLRGMYYPGKKSEEIARKKNFFASADDFIMIIENAVLKFFNEGSHTEQLKVITYVFYSALHDWWILHPEEHASDIRYMIQTLGTFCDRMVPKDSELILPINQIFWTTWNDLQMEDKNVYLHENAGFQSEEEHYVRTEPSQIMRSLNDNLTWEKLEAVA